MAIQAIGRFKARAESYSKQFGFGGYSLREVAVGGGEVGNAAPVYRVRALAAPTVDETQPVKAGKTTVSGSMERNARESGLVTSVKQSRKFNQKLFWQLI